MALTDRELKQINSLLPQTSSIMASAVGKLLLSSPNPKVNRGDPSSIFASFPHISSNDWSDTGVVGALCLVVDRLNDSVMFQIYDLDGFLKRFEFELYYDMEYLSLDPSFHAFEMEECVAGFSFSNREVSRKFLAKVRAMTPDVSSKIADSQGSEPAKSKKGGLFGVGGTKAKPMQISTVVNVVHHQHVGMLGDGSLDLNTVSPEWRQIFKQAGVKKKDLKNPETSRALIQSIQQSGYSLATAPGQYVHASPLKPKEGPLAQKRVPPAQMATQISQPSLGSANPARQTKVYTPQELQKDYTKQQVDMYVAYQQQLAEYEKAQKKYLEELAEYERQMALQKWEKDNQGFLQEQEKVKRMSKDPRYAAAPPLPPRKKKTITGSEAPSNSDNRPRFETAPANSATKSMASVPSITTFSLPTGPSKKPLPSPIHAPQPKGPLRLPERRDMVDDVPHRPMSPEVPAPPPLPALKNGDNPVFNLQDQLMAQAGKLKPADRPQSKMMLRAVAGSQLDLRDVVNAGRKNDPSKTEDILGTLINALAVRRAQLGEDDNDSDDDWSD